MKKLISIFLTMVLLVSLAACGKNDPTDAVADTNSSAENQIEVENKEDGKSEELANTDNNEEKPEKKPSAKPQDKPAVKPSDSTTKPEVKPETKPEVKPEVTPEAKPEVKPEVKPEDNTPKTLGNTLLADFKAKASTMGVLALADALISNPVIKFSGGAMPVSEGLLSGFGNTEIKGFKEGAMFAPMIGSIPFVGYVFELDDASKVSSFISTLKSSADLRWNVCVEADEMLTGSVGSKVFFVMAPYSIEE